VSNHDLFTRCYGDHCYEVVNKQSQSPCWSGKLQKHTSLIMALTRSDLGRNV